jgi:hypothetical protein
MIAQRYKSISEQMPAPEVLRKRNAAFQRNWNLKVQYSVPFRFYQGNRC